MDSELMNFFFGIFIGALLLFAVCGLAMTVNHQSAKAACEEVTKAKESSLGEVNNSINAGIKIEREFAPLREEQYELRVKGFEKGYNRPIEESLRDKEISDTFNALSLKYDPINSFLEIKADYLEELKELARHIEDDPIYVSKRTSIVQSILNKLDQYEIKANKLVKKDNTAPVVETINIEAPTPKVDTIQDILTHGGDIAGNFDKTPDLFTNDGISLLISTPALRRSSTDALTN